MVLISITMIIMAAVFCVSPYAIKQLEKKQEKWIVALMMLAFFVIKIILAGAYFGHSTDVNCFWGWSQMLAETGIGDFYTSDAFTDYPPGYMYILSLIGMLKKVFDVGDVTYLIMLKLPAIICDMVIGYLIYKIASKKFSKNGAFFLSTLYVMNPAVIINSSLWGQVDSIHTLGIIIVFLLLCDKKLIQSFFVFAVCIFIKPQSLIFTPLLLFSAAEYVFLPKFDKNRLIKVILGGFGALAVMVIMALPFGILSVIKQYISTIESYPYLTINAFNLWGALGQNWTELTPYFSYLGNGFIIIITLISAFIFFRNKGNKRYFLTGAFLMFATFMLSVKMHDRYAYPVIAMLLFAYIMSEEKIHFGMFSVISISQYFNQAWILFIYESDPALYIDSPIIIIASIINVLILLYMTVKLSKFSLSKEEAIPENRSEKITKKDAYIMCAVALLYSIFAFCNLGSTKAPKTSCEISYDDEILITMPGSDIDSFHFYLGADDITDDMYINYYCDGELVLSDVADAGDAFFWNEREADVFADSVAITTQKDSLELFEVVFKDINGDIIPISSNYDEISDEQELLPERVTFMNSSYFDEIYHARTAYEFVEGKEVYEWTHPPLGKVFIALGVKIFGMNPFGWRIIGTVFGVMMVFLIYALAKRIFKETMIATVGCILFSFDFMHFTQTRIATIDVYVTFFIMLMYYFMYKYYVMDFQKVSLKESFKPLLLAGVSFGLGTACKWTAMYACAGLAIIFFITIIRRFTEEKNRFLSWFFKTCGFCVIAFIVIPIIIYCISYIPYLMANNDFSFSAIWQNQVDIFTYHGDTVVGSEHPFASPWYSWPILYRPMWYYEGTVSQTIKEGISAFGNPVVWWLGIPSFFISCYYGIIKREKKAAFLVIGYLSCLLPWVFVKRTMYIYHYFPCVIFSVLMICFVLTQFEFKTKKYVGIALCAAAVSLFLLFYPVLSGASVAEVYVDELLRWMKDTWVLIG